MSRAMIPLALAASLAWVSIPHQFPVLGRGIPMAASTASTDLTSADMVFKGWYTAPATDDNGNAVDYSFGSSTYEFPGATLRQVGGVNHFLISTNIGATSAGAPVELIEPATWDTAGNCTSGTCPSATLALAKTNSRIPAANAIGWGVNADGTVHDFYGGLKSDLWNMSTGTLDGTCQGHTCSVMFIGTTPSGDILSSIQPQYGNASLVSEDTGTTATSGYIAGSILTVLTSENKGGPRMTSATGPFVFKEGTGVAPPVSGYGSATGLNFRAVGSYAARWFTNMPDGTLAIGSGDPAMTQFYGIQGPSLETIPAANIPTSSTTPTATLRILTTTKYLHFWDLTGYFPSATGVLPGGQPNWSFRFPGYQYAFEGNSTAPNYAIPSSIDPFQNGGVGSWGDADHLNGAVVINDGKQGAIFFMDTTTNHLSNGVIACSGGATPGTNEPAHAFYENTGVGQGPNCTVHNCNWAGSSGLANTGPVSSIQESQFVFFKWSDMQTVNGGTKTDYTVDPSDRWYPQDHLGVPVAGPIGADQPRRIVPIGYDTTHHLLYVEFYDADREGCCNRDPGIAVFYITQT